MPGRYRAIWLDQQTGHHFLIAVADDGFGPLALTEAKKLLGRRDLNGSREIADALSEHPAGRVVDVTPPDPFAPPARPALDAMKELAAAPPNGGERFQARLRALRALIDAALRP